MEKRFYGITKNYMIDDLLFEDDDIVVDVGANIGDLKGFINLKKNNIQYFAFEPSKKEFEILKLNCKDSKTINKGCWYENGVQTFYISSEGADSSFEKPSSKIESIIETEVIRLDSYFSEEIKLIKIDGEGCELEILKGCSNILHLINYISVDAGYERGEQNLCTFAEVSNFLYEKGFILEKFQAKGRVCGLFRNNC